jgi:hypothetical protein
MVVRRRCWPSLLAVVVGRRCSPSFSRFSPVASHPHPHPHPSPPADCSLLKLGDPCLALLLPHLHVPSSVCQRRKAELNNPCEFAASLLCPSNQPLVKWLLAVYLQQKRTPRATRPIFTASLMRNYKARLASPP